MRTIYKGNRYKINLCTFIGHHKEIVSSAILLDKMIIHKRCRRCGIPFKEVITRR